MIRTGFCLAVLASAAMVRAQPPQFGGQVQSIPYLANQIVPLTVAAGYATLVELSPDERIDTIVVGDSNAWQVTTTKQGNEFVVKPVTTSAFTDLIVSTGSRRYIFLLKPADGANGGPFVLHFDYPEPWSPMIAAKVTTMHYRLRGDRDLFPAEISGDGERTSIVWTTGTALPAIFALDEKGHEALVNGHMVGQTYVVEGTAKRYVFRRDKAKAEAIRDKAATDRR